MVVRNGRTAETDIPAATLRAARQLLVAAFNAVRIRFSETE